MLALAAALLLQPPGELPLWLAGTWCPTDWQGPKVTAPEPGPALSFTPPSGEWNGLGQTCLRWEALGDRSLRGIEGVRFSGVPDIERTMLIEPNGGGLRFRSSYKQWGPPRWSGSYREISRRPSEIVFAHGRSRVRLSREGDLLTIEGKGAGAASERYRRRT